MKQQIARIVARVKTWRLVRALQRYGNARGALLSGGIAYTALFSIAGALTLGITITIALLGNNPELRTRVFETIAQSLPGVLDINGSGGILKPESLVMNAGYSIAGIIAVVVLLFSAVRVMTALKTSLRSMFGIVTLPGNPIIETLRDFLGFLILMVAVLVTAVLSLAASALGTQVLGALEVGGAARSALLESVAIGIGALVDAGVLVMLIRFVAQVRALWRDMVLGAVIFALASAILRKVGTAAVGSVTSPLLASFAAIVTVLLWVNLLARVVLIVAAIIANPPAPEEIESPEQVHARETPNHITMSAPETLEWPHLALGGQLDVETASEIADEQSAAPPYFGGAIGAWLERRIRHHERRIALLRHALYRGTDVSSTGTDRKKL